MDKIEEQRELELESPAKINLSLDVLDKREDGYHNIVTIFQEIDIIDKIHIKAVEGDELDISCDYKLLPMDEDNIIYSVWDRMKDLCPSKPGLRVHIEKNIPIAAGLAGGSSNATAMIKGLNEIWNLDLNKEEMKSIGREIGADVPFFFEGGTCLGQGKGDELSKLPSLEGMKVLLVNKGIGVSTPYVYKRVVPMAGERVDIDGIARAISEKDYQSLYEKMENKLEAVTMSLDPDIKEIKDKMLAMGAQASLMCGSGPTVFGIFEDESQLGRAFFYFKDKYDLVFSSETR